MHVVPPMIVQWDVSKPRPSWEIYERLVARLLVNDLSTDMCVTTNAQVPGLISGAVRQVDVLIDARHTTDNSRRIVVDAKKRRRKIDIQHVESFEAFMKDVGATHGYLVSPSGHSEAAERRAQDAITIFIVPLEHIESIDPSSWPACLGSKCREGRVFWDGYPEMSLVVRKMSGPLLAEPTTLTFVHFVGKCDRCGRFHVKCLTCGELFSLDDDEGDHKCRCNLPWFWLASIEQDEHGTPSAELHVIAATGRVMTVTRRPHVKPTRA